MKSPTTPPDSSWENLVRQARADRAPAADLAALRQAVRTALLAPPPAEGWLGEFAALLLAPRALPACLGAAAAGAMIASWEAWDLWQMLPWAQWIAGATGGAS